jgi:hypothetical protein
MFRPWAYRTIDQCLLRQSVLKVLQKEYKALAEEYSTVFLKNLKVQAGRPAEASSYTISHEEECDL